MAHNFYQQPGGEDRSFAAEADMLEKNGHDVYRYTLHNDDIPDMGKLKLAQDTIWNRDVYRELSAIFAKDHYDIAHFQNTFPRISPAAYAAAQDADVPVVQSLRNFRLMCPNGIFFRDGHVCEDCLGKTIPYPAVVHSCYRDSKAQSAVVTAMLSVHNLRGTWHKQVDKYIALTNFTKQKFVEAGMDEARIAVKPNFLQDDPGIGPELGDYMLFVGRMTPEKGILTVLKAWQQLSGIPLKVVGDGPIFEEAQAFVQEHHLKDVELLGRQKPDETLKLMKGARCLVFPSEWYETFGRVAIEAFAAGTTVIAAKIGAITEVVDHEKTGLHFTPGDADDLAQKVRQVWDDEARTIEMCRNARKEYENRYTAEHNYQLMMDIYTTVAERTGHD